jgi:hypothetical protein
MDELDGHLALADQGLQSDSREVQSMHETDIILQYRSHQRRYQAQIPAMCVLFRSYDLESPRRHRALG